MAARSIGLMAYRGMANATLITSARLGTCEACRFSDIPVTRHHIVPRSVSPGSQEKVDLCPDCHEALHRAVSNPELAAMDRESQLTAARQLRHIRLAAA